jgi:signal transduction histidine kinase
MRPLSAHAGLLPRAFAISLGLASAGPEYACRVRGAQVAALVRFSPLVIVANSVIAAILLVTLDDDRRLTWPVIVWGCVLTLCLTYYWRVWHRQKHRGEAGRPASRKAIGRAVLHGGLFGAVWGVVPVLVSHSDLPSLQVMVGCITTGMICAGGFILATVPLAGGLFVTLMLAGATRSILSTVPGNIDVGLLALLWVYGAVVMICLCCNAHLFVEHFLAEARLQTEISARERAQAEVAHARRMSALGALAGGVAHDFNNILQSVAGNASLVMTRGGDVQQASQLAGRILDAAERGGAISRRLLAFARQDALSAEPVDVAGLLQSAAGLLEHTLHRSIGLVVRAPPDLPLVLADKAQLETVLVNLAANARDAMPRGGMLRFEAAAETVPAGLAPSALLEGLYVRIDVTDTGAGMDAATLERAAEPFFTTKPKGKGTGLGLSMAKGFAEQSGGAFSIESAPGAGTVVTLWLPQTRERAPARRAVCAAPGFRAPVQRLLVVEDDPDVRDTLVRTLEDAGFDAVGAPNAAVAVGLIDRGLEIDLLITDHSMPGMTGLELLNEVQVRRPGLPGILLTGHVDEVPAALGGRVMMLQKPVHPNQLIHHVWQSLGAQMVS